MALETSPEPAVPPAPVHGAAFTASDWAIFSAISLIWGASFLFIAVGLDSLEPGVITLLRVGLGAAILHLLPGSSMRLARADRGRMVLLSVIWIGIPFSLFPIAEQHINSAVAGLLNGATPMFTAVFAWLFFRRRTTGAQLAGVAVGFAGIALISAPSFGDGSSAAGGVAMVLLATCCYGAAAHIALPLQTTYGSQAVMARMLALGTVWTLPYGLFGLPDSSVELGPVLAVSVLGLVGTGIAFLLMGSLVVRVGATRSSFITYLTPVVALGLGVVFEDDHVEALALAGVVLVVIGAVLAGRRET
jgi:drug/metabolite transporter (DMT)-like permease